MASVQPTIDLPRRIPHTNPDVSGLVCGPDHEHVRTARRWATRAIRATPSVAQPVVVSLAELHANALRHTASGLAGGRVRIEIERRRCLFLLRVTDDGPRPGAKITVPEVVTAAGPAERGALVAEGGYGLALVDALALYWDFTGERGGPLTVRAAFDRSGRTRLPW
ncbi:ATP-binding protein [Nocardiopsis sp. EMB25]|uniref:ATP-binding protein n=1 Tax=Nocardiopsis sp. EMB25 TaxID=2835867 RepID=UPI002284D975|nr:ATP-binding protein [Nocardiopsis sp. EMB25]MCY9782558.1 ATP-binding protein [Nocardiopsis sp. EMB25]